MIGIALALYVIEFVADKIPYIDSTWDVVHTPIRIPAGAMLAAAAFGDLDAAFQVIALLLGGGLALSSHGLKATARAAINTSPETVSNVAARVAEDVVGSMLLAAFVPFVLVVLVTVGVIISIVLFPHMLKQFRALSRNTPEDPEGP